MVIITTLVAKVYFPASLERGSIPNIRRKYAYRRRPTMEEEEEEHSDAEDDDDELEALYSDEDEDNNAEEEAEDRALEYEHEDPLVADLTGSPGVATGSRRTTGGGMSRGPAGAAAAATRPLEFDQVHTSQAKVLQRLVLCCLMLQATFVTWGALQERMLTRRYPRHTGDYFTYS